VSAEKSCNLILAAYQIAEDEVGVHEVPGPGNNKRILEYHMSTVLRASEDSVPWCSAFVNWCVTRAGLLGTNSARARSWLSWGLPVSEPYEGCIVVMSRGTNPAQGHVGFWVAQNNRYVWVLGGNQKDAVNVSKYPIQRILGYRQVG
jgi:uncharacterized protein (TIGR02594 family)